MKSIKKMTNAELAAFIQSHLRNKGIDVVLSGGACVSTYSSNRYVSMDLDLISTRFAKKSRIREAMREIGFSEEGRYFKHPDTEFFVEFPGGPLSVGDEPVKEIVEVAKCIGDDWNNRWEEVDQKSNDIVTKRRQQGVLCLA